MNDKNVRYEKLIEQLKKYMDEPSVALIEKAYNLATEAHSNQVRNDGMPYVTHPLEVAYILATRNLDPETVCAGILHDILEDTKYDYDYLVGEFGEEVANLVEGVTKSEKVRYRSHDEYNAENLKKVLFATAKDVRVMIIKLADRVHNMRTLGTFNEEKRKRIALETLEIYVPIAHKLGMWAIKGELEDLSLRFTEPLAYNMLKEKINEKRVEREQYTEKVISDLGRELSKAGIKAKISGRAKYFYSIYQKMKKKGKQLEEINDLVALRIITDSVSHVYSVLEIVKTMYEFIDGRYKDYVSHPKENQYQSIHLDVKTPTNKVLEIQIRTEEMHHRAEEGVAAHWRYKEVSRDKKFDRKLSWLKQILDWKKEFSGEEFVSSLKIDLFKNEVIILTPAGDTIILPEGSSPVDFAYAIHTNVGNTCSKTEVNGKMVPLDYTLKSGDTVRIFTKKNAHPSRNWLNFVKTSKAKAKIRGILNIKMEKDPKYYRNMQSIEDNLIKYVDYRVKKNLKLSKCCNPQFNDKIVAFKTKDGAITIHKQTCPNIHLFDQSKKIEMIWKKEDKTIKKIYISVKDRIGLLDEFLQKALECKVHAMNINVRSTKHNNLVIEMKVKSDDDVHLNKSLDEFSKIPGVFSTELVDVNDKVVLNPVNN